MINSMAECFAYNEADSSSSLLLPIRSFGEMVDTTNLKFVFLKKVTVQVR